MSVGQSFDDVKRQRVFVGIRVSSTISGSNNEKCRVHGCIESGASAGDQTAAEAARPWG